MRSLVLVVLADEILRISYYCRGIDPTIVFLLSPIPKSKAFSFQRSRKNCCPGMSSSSLFFLCCPSAILVTVLAHVFLVPVTRQGDAPERAHWTFLQQRLVIFSESRRPVSRIQVLLARNLVAFPIQLLYSSHFPLLPTVHASSHSQPDDEKANGLQSPTACPRPKHDDGPMLAVLGRAGL